LHHIGRHGGYMMKKPSIVVRSISPYGVNMMRDVKDFLRVPLV
jgi:hypothetical protein